ncbi:hypothetical protein [Rhodoblastus sp.]|uniref:hypothetical protein n=1 Tax=Rhodoblastus sp. TaxID=1962975 RepID=UPI003F9EABE0
MRAANQTSAKNRKPPETGRYVLLVDAQAKRSFDSWDAAAAEAKRILDRFPHLHVGVEDRERSNDGIRTRS